MDGAYLQWWGQREHRSVRLVVPDVVAEVTVDVARDQAGQRRHPVRATRLRTDMELGDVPPFGTA
ncbi:hypothetical protein B1R27_15920 [Streptomyces sp. GKU 895]|nr:hypothetical protein B1R27_15920 [Streptomyces sp. GKU 895]